MSDQLQTTQQERELISNIAEAEAYLTGFVDGTAVALRLHSVDVNVIRARCARMREFTDEAGERE